MRRLKVRRGVSEVVAAVVLAAVTLTVGSVIWAFAQSATIAATNDYINGTFTTMKDIIERFTIEYVDYDSTTKTLKVWVYNYGSIDIVIDVYTTLPNTPPLLNIKVRSRAQPECVTFLDVTLSSGTEVDIQVHSGRQNDAYFNYYYS